LVEGSAADPSPKKSEPSAPKGVVGTADDPDPEASAQGATDPAMHNPRGPLDAETKTDGGGTGEVDPNAPKMPAPQGPAQTKNSEHPVRGAPPRRPSDQV